MHFQWYPGHMTKAKRMMRENMKLIDLVIELVDARIPLSSRNPDIDELGKGKARLVLLNKSDLAEEHMNNAWAEFFREKRAIPTLPSSLQMDQHAQRIDAREKVNGTGLFADDLYFDGMLYAKAVFSKYPRARIDRIDVSKAQAHPDCVKVLTKADVPCNKIGHIKQDWDVMMGEGDITRYVGNVLAVVATDKKEKLEEIADLVEVDYTELTPVTTPFDALKGDAPLIHEDGNVMSRANLVRGNADEAIKNSKYVVTRKYKTSWQEHGFMEPECCVALPEGKDGLLIYTTSQSIYDVQRECAKALGLPLEKVHCRAPLVGGGFGGKEDMTVQPYAALMAWVTKRPVKVKYTRQESLDYHVKRHPMEMEFTTACDENGILTGMKGIIIADTGAYASLGGPVLHRACTHAAGPYNYQNIDIFGMSVYTNNVVSGAFRGRVPLVSKGGLGDWRGAWAVPHSSTLAVYPPSESSSMVRWTVG